MPTENTATRFRNRQGENNSNFRHGYNCIGNVHPIYKAWIDARRRCYTPTYRRFDRYGGRGISMCVGYYRFKNFLDDLFLTWNPELTLDRIDVNGHYSCGKCVECIHFGWKFNLRWASWTQQQENKTNNRVIQFEGKTMTVSQWERHTGISRRIIYSRLNRKWPIEEVLCSRKFSSQERKNRMRNSVTELIPDYTEPVPRVWAKVMP